MIVATAIEHQNILDIAIVHTGRASNAFAIADYNGFDVSDQLEPGQQLQIPDGLEVDSDIMHYYRNKGHNPATAFPVLIAEETDYFPAFPGMLSLMLS